MPTYSFDEALSSIGMGWSHAKTIAVCVCIVISDALEYQMMALLGPVLRCEWKLEKGESTMITTSLIAGYMLGTMVAGWMSDAFGRKFTLQIGCVWSFALGLLSTQAQSLEVMCLLRGLSGMGLSVVPVASDLFLELLPIQNRGRNFCLLLTSWGIGPSIMVGIGWATLNQYGWRYMVTVGSIPIGISAVLLTLLPESPRYLHTRGQHAEAKEVLEAMAEANGTQLPEGELVVEQEVSQPLAKTIGVMFSGSLRLTTILVCMLYASELAVDLSMVIMPSEMAADAHKDKDICKLMTATHMSPFDDEDFFGMAIVTVGSVPATLFAAFTIDWWGRRNVITCAFGMAFCGVAFLFLGMPLNVKMYCMAFVNAIMGAVFAAVWCYSREVYPTTYRSTASALFSLSARCGAILVPSVIQFCFQSGYHGLALSVLACAALMGVVSGLNLEVETSNMALDKIADQVQLGTSAASSETTESAGLLKSETKTAHSYTKA